MRHDGRILIETQETEQRYQVVSRFERIKALPATSPLLRYIACVRPRFRPHPKV
jgi:hypothetical protein